MKGIFQDDESDQLLQQCINYHLGPAMPVKTPKNTYTEKVEGLNRAIRSTLAANVTYEKNFKVRAHTACHKVNHGLFYCVMLWEVQLSLELK